MKFLPLAVLLCWTAMFGWNTAVAQQSKTVRNTHESIDSLRVWVFLAIDCPISQKYIGELRRIDSVYAANKVRVKGVIPGKVNPVEVKAFVEEYAIKFPVQIDRNFTSVRKFHATVTPEVVLVDAQEHIFYQGAIDNWFFDLGKYRQRVTEHYLESAIEAVVQGVVPIVQKTDAVGCPIQVQ